MEQLKRVFEVDPENCRITRVDNIERKRKKKKLLFSKPSPIILDSLSAYEGTVCKYRDLASERTQAHVRSARCALHLYTRGSPPRSPPPPRRLALAPAGVSSLLLFPPES